MFGIDQPVEKWSDVWRRRELARAFNVHGYFDGWLDLAKAFEREGNYHLAIKVWERALEKHPTSKWAEQELAGVYDTKATRHENPIDVYEKALEHHPTSEVLCARVRNSLMATREFDRMIGVFEHLLECHPTQRMVPLYLAEGYSAIGSDKAISVLNKAILEYVREAPFSNLIKTRVSSGDYIVLHESLKNPSLKLSDQILPRTFARLLVMKGYVDAAKEVLTDVLRHHPSDPDVFDDLCANGHYDEALRILTGGLRKDSYLLTYAVVLSNSAGYILAVAKAYKMRGNFDGAIEQLSKARDLYPMRYGDFHRLLHETISGLYKEKGDRQGRIDFCREATKKYPTEEWPRTLLTDAYEDEGDLEKAREIYVAMEKTRQIRVEMRNKKDPDPWRLRRSVLGFSTF